MVIRFIIVHYTIFILPVYCGLYVLKPKPFQFVLSLFIANLIVVTLRRWSVKDKILILWDIIFEHILIVKLRV